MNYFTPAEIVEIAKEKGVEKANSSPKKLLVLSFLGGMYIALGFLAYVRVAGTMPAEWGSFSSFLGACVFPIGLIAVLLEGGELITGNMMVMPIALARKAITPKGLIYNWALVTLGNLLGAVATAYFFGHVVGLTEGAFLEKTIAIATAKVSQDFFPSLVSGVGCNIFVCMGVWLCFGAKDFTGKILGIWFPVMVFVAIGFQHVVANMFIVPAALFSGASALTWSRFWLSCIPVYIGNVIGGGVMLGLLYHIAYPAQAKG